MTRAVRHGLALACAWAVCVGVPGSAAEIVEGPVVRTDVGTLERRALELGLSQEDWSRYQELMRGQRGVWTPDADPLLVLGAHARTEEERRRYAEAFVMAEFERVEGELAFERAVQAAWARLFPGQPRLRVAREAGADAERYAVLVDRECTDCGRTVRRYARGAVPVDVYVRGAADDGDLRLWVGEQGLEVEAIAAGRVTVNHGGRGDFGDVPGVWARGPNGRWEVVE